MLINGCVARLNLVTSRDRADDQSLGRSSGFPGSRVVTRDSCFPGSCGVTRDTCNTGGAHVCSQDHVFGSSTLVSLRDYNWALGQVYWDLFAT